LYHNPACIVSAHRHRSGVAEPSPGYQVNQALALLDVKLLNRFVASADCVMSPGEKGLV